MRIAKARSRPSNSKGRTVALGAILALMALAVVTLSFLIGDDVPLAPSTDTRSQEANDTPGQFPALQQSAGNDTAGEATEVETGEPNAVESIEHPIQTVFLAKFLIAKDANFLAVIYCNDKIVSGNIS